MTKIKKNCKKIKPKNAGNSQQVRLQRKTELMYQTEDLLELGKRFKKLPLRCCEVWRVIDRTKAISVIGWGQGWCGSELLMRQLALRRVCVSSMFCSWLNLQHSQYFFKLSFTGYNCLDLFSCSKISTKIQSYFSADLPWMLHKSINQNSLFSFRQRKNSHAMTGSSPDILAVWMVTCSIAIRELSAAFHCLQKVWFLRLTEGISSYPVLICL